MEYLAGLLIVVGFVLVLGLLMVIIERYPDAFFWVLVTVIVIILFGVAPWIIGHAVLGG